MTSRTVALALLVVAAVAGFAATGDGSTGVAVLSLASVAAVLAVPPRGRLLLGLTVVAVALLVGVTGAGLADAALLLSVGALATAGLITALRGRRWPSLARRYGGTGDADELAREPADLWRALDRGEDPTEDAPEPREPRHDVPSVD